MTTNETSPLSGDDLISLLDQGRWKVPHLSDNTALLAQVFDAAKKHPDRMMDLIGAMTHIEHRLNHGYEVLGGLIRLLWPDTAFDVPQLLEAVLDAGEYFSMEDQAKLMGQAMDKAVRSDGKTHSSEAKVQDIVVGQLRKQQAWGQEHMAWQPMACFIRQITEDSKHKFSWELGPLEERRMSTYQRRLDLLLRAGVPLEGSMDLAARNYQGRGAYDHCYIPFRVLLEAGADWQGALHNPSVSELAKNELRQEPIVRRWLLGQEVQGQRQKSPGFGRPKPHL